MSIITHLVDLINQTSTLELIANATLIVSVFLAAKNNIHQWWIGIIGCGLFGMLFYNYQLYADVNLQVFFILSSLYGWYYWKQGFNGTEAPIRTSTPLFIACLLVPSGIVAIAYGMILARYTNAYAPFWDTGILIASLLGQYLLMARRFETWFAWLIVDTIAVPLYYSRGLELTAIVYAIFWCNVWYGMYNWHKEMNDYNIRKSL